MKVKRNGVALGTLLGMLISCRGGDTPARASSGESRLLPTGAALDPAGASVSLGSMPLAMVVSPSGRDVVVLLNGYGKQGIQVVDRWGQVVVQTIEQPAAFLGLAFSPDGRWLFASGGNEDVVYQYAWDHGRAGDRTEIRLHPGTGKGTVYPSGIGVSPDGTRLYVALNLADSLAVIDIRSGRVIQRLPTGRYPYAVAVSGDGTVYVSAWGGNTVEAYRPAKGTLRHDGSIPAGRHPSALLLNADGSRLFAASSSTDRVTVINTESRDTVTVIGDPAPAGPGEGSTPNALTLSPDGTRLFIAEADNNAVAVVELSAAAANLPGATGNNRVSARIPVAWYPTAVAVRGDSLLVVSGKGNGSSPNPREGTPDQGSDDDSQYTLGQLTGVLSTVRIDFANQAALDSLTARVGRANHWGDSTRAPAKYPPFEHVIYVIKENRTYDQVLGDLSQGDGDSSLVFFGRDAAPNHHALAERFGIFDRFFVNAEVSADGHNWSTAAYAADYVEKTVASNYSGRGREYDYEGTNRGVEVEDDVNEPGNGYLWDLVEKAGITLRNYGEFVNDAPVNGRYRATKTFLNDHTNSDFPGWDLDIPDQRRMDVWLPEFQQYIRDGNLPQLEFVRLPSDHTSGASAGKPTPRAYMADNDLALGRLVDALSRSPFWKNTVVFVLEDDAQNGPDHVDSHRSPLLVISAYNKGGVIHRFANTTDVIATITEILHLGALSQFDYFGRPLRDIWAASPDLSPYTALVPEVPLTEKNPANTALARASRHLVLGREDRSDDDLFNRILWRQIKGEAPYPGVHRLALLELHLNR
ncbi:MAG TPA: alkaline phosphatase family protein [Gemmatimonadales bacterium]|nr:alkaline phosphatase family protein [Gemmatimonadales bacterium]